VLPSRGGAALSIYKVGVPIKTMLPRFSRFLPFFFLSCPVRRRIPRFSSRRYSPSVPGTT